jgi:hypothetical protein
VRYAIRDIAVLAEQLAREGKEILPLNIGDPLLFDFRTPPHLIEAVEKAMRDGHKVVSHGGEVGGFVASNTVFPDDKIAIVVLTNQEASPAAGSIALTLSEVDGAYWNMSIDKPRGYFGRLYLRHPQGEGGSDGLPS